MNFAHEKQQTIPIQRIRNFQQFLEFMKNALTKPGWHAWHVFKTCSKLEAMAIYLF